MSNQEGFLGSQGGDHTESGEENLARMWGADSRGFRFCNMSSNKFQLITVPRIKVIYLTKLVGKICKIGSLFIFLIRTYICHHHKMGILFGLLTTFSSMSVDLFFVISLLLGAF